MSRRDATPGNLQSRRRTAVIRVFAAGCRPGRTAPQGRLLASHHARFPNFLHSQEPSMSILRMTDLDLAGKNCRDDLIERDDRRLHALAQAELEREVGRGECTGDGDGLAAGA